MNKTLSILCLGGLGFLLSGCIASERDMGALKLQLKELNEALAVMQTNQAELAGKMEELNDGTGLWDGSAALNAREDLSDLLKTNMDKIFEKLDICIGNIELALENSKSVDNI